MKVIHSEPRNGPKEMCWLDFQGKDAGYLEVLNLVCEIRRVLGEGWWEERERDIEGKRPKHL